MNYQGLQRLAEEHKLALSNTEERLTKWNKFKEDYLTLQTKLNDLPSQVTYDYMVPFGPLAFMPGQLIHTNEILVLLGDNWFAEMSAKQSCEVIDRRLADIDKSIDSLNQQKKLLGSRADFTQHKLSSSEVDINEECDSDEDRRWRDSHKKSVRREKLAEKKAACHTDDDVFGKLESLQLQEMRGHEMSRLAEEVEHPMHAEKSLSDQKKAVHWNDEAVTAAEVTAPEVAEELRLPAAALSIHKGGSSDTSNSMDSDDSDSCTSSVIYFKHSPRTDPEVVERSLVDQSAGTIQSPADLYRLHTLASRPKSILKRERSFEETKSTNPHSGTSPQKVRYIQSTPEQHAALQSHVVEKNPTDSSQSTLQTTSLPQADTSTPSSQQQPLTKPKVSKFKAMRQKRQT